MAMKLIIFLVLHLSYWSLSVVLKLLLQSRDWHGQL